MLGVDSGARRFGIETTLETPGTLGTVKRNKNWEGLTYVVK
jgi:hypothetical protein